MMCSARSFSELRSSSASRRSSSAFRPRRTVPAIACTATLPWSTWQSVSGLAHEGDPLAVLEARMRPYRYVRLPELSMFTGGAVGYISFDCVQHFEPRTRRPLRDPVGVPESVHMLCDTLVAFDHVFQCV